jgi:phospholipid/cholesterol/gamma-HCH transport system ATP-binding protein
MPMKSIVAKIENLKKSFGINNVLRDVSLEIEKGENLVIFGKSGTGKSVLIKCLVGLMEPDAGKVTLLGEDLTTLTTRELNLLRKKVGFLFQNAALYDSMTVRENLKFPLRDAGLTDEALEVLVVEALTNVGLEDAIDKMPADLSGGMRKRIGLARSLILKPEIILYDEPTTGLDPITSKEISNLIVDIQRKYHTAAIIITHDVECARITSNRMMIINSGVTVVEGSFEELSNSTDEWVRSFFE